MKLPLSWLNEYVKVEDDPKTLADKLLNIGFEVEEIIYVGKGIENVVVGEIESVEKHPDATKLQVCNVNVGKEKIVIITGANNISVGDRVPIALDGANLPNGAHIVSSPLRGIMSYGMMCSGEELCIDDNVLEGAEVHGILILPKDAPIGEDIKKVLGLDEYVFDISVPANRPDCQSVYGMAREVAAIYGTQAKKPEIGYKEVKTAGKPIKVTIEATIFVRRIRQNRQRREDRKIA
ncbi:MAG: YtpR family tRNA-binding protein [Christensenellales bacterium]